MAQYARPDEKEAHDIHHVFLMTGANPNTAWLDGCLQLDEKQFIKTGADLGERLESAAASVSARNQPSGSLCCGRYPGGKHQARRVRGRRGIHGGADGPQGSERIRQVARLQS